MKTQIIMDNSTFKLMILQDTDKIINNYFIAIITKYAILV